MKVTEYCGFFDFSIERGKFVDPDDEDDSITYKYCISDDQGCWDDRFCNDIEDVIDKLDGLYQNYIYDIVEEDGFEEDKTINKPYIEQVFIFAEENYKEDPIFVRIIKVLAGFEKLEDDT